MRNNLVELEEKYEEVKDRLRESNQFLKIDNQSSLILTSFYKELEVITDNTEDPNELPNQLTNLLDQYKTKYKEGE